ncbi:MAG TPA: D-glucuronyl C5-epimerase family protein [Nitrososphaeraceae archaeon]|nr:D-glucuronyl C5-epimerase family protein [Nitrososphaeraceae archaeon]
MYVYYTTITAIIVISIFSIVDYYHSSNFLVTLPTVSAEKVIDDNGVIKYIYPGFQHSVYNPLTLSSGGLSYLTEYKNTGDMESGDFFINTAHWLVDNAKYKEGGRYSLWEYDFTWPWYGGVPPPYSSALAQSTGMVVLVHAYHFTGNAIYLDEAHKAFQALLVDYGDGGVMTIEDDNGDSIFLHLLAKPGFPKTYVLNGHTGSLLHIWEYYELTGDPQAKSIFDKGINYLKHNLWKYDTGSWSLYDLTLIDQSENVAWDVYHKAMIDHLTKLYDISGESILKEYADKFSKYLNQPSPSPDSIAATTISAFQ